MAALADIHWETVTPQMRAILSGLGRAPWMGRFYLGGGTAVALRLGHRRSIDLDFFSESDPIDAARRRAILASFEDHDPKTVEDVRGNLLLQLDDHLHIAFLSYGYPLMDATDDVEGVAIASLRDLGLMKLDASIGRGSRKDFADLYFIARELDLESLLELAATKYPHARDFPLMAVESLLQFENADRDEHPEMLASVTWNEIRGFFEAEVRRLGARWLGSDGTG